MIELEFENELNTILDKYTENSWRNEPLDDDEVNNLVKHIKNMLNLKNGNITRDEYFELEK